MSQEDAKAGEAPQAAGPAGGSEEQPAAAVAGTPEAAERAPRSSRAAAAGEGAAAPGGVAGGAAGRPPARAAGRSARAARAGAAGARSTAAVSARPGAAGAVAAAGTGDVSRRGFLSWITAGWLAFGALTAGTLIGTVRFLFPNVLFEPPQTFRAGFPEEYTVGDVSTRFKDQFAVWIVRTPTEIYVLSTVCTHLGCTPNWLSGEQKFKCPCHGSGFRKTGINFEGPAPRPLERYRVTMADDGQILVDKTRKYQWEKDEWSDPESFLAV